LLCICRLAVLGFDSSWSGFGVYMNRVSLERREASEWSGLLDSFFRSAVLPGLLVAFGGCFNLLGFSKLESTSTCKSP